MADVGMDLYLAYEDGYKAGKEDAVPKWISVEERLPEINVSVLAIAKFKECGGYRFEISSWSGVTNHGVPHFWEFGDAMEVTHWMPLPEPPKEVDEK